MNGSRAWLRNVVSALSVTVHVGLGYLYVVSGLVVPAGVLTVLVMAWAGLFVLAIRWWATPVHVLVIPFIAAALWAVVVLGLGSLFNWSA